MEHTPIEKPVVLVLAGHDPSGGAGIQADIETTASLGCITTSVITSLTAQNTQLFSSHLPQKKEDFIHQIDLILDDVTVDTCKIGAIGSPELIRIIHKIFIEQSFPIVLDPVLHSTTGYDFVTEEMCHLLCKLLLPLATVITPNRDEAMQLTGETDPLVAAKKFLKMGCRNILITDAENSKTQVTNHLFQENGQHQIYQWDRLPGNYHGSGCTLSSAIAANLAKDFAIDTAIEQAQEYTWQSLKHGIKIGKGQRQANRFYNQTVG